jgi:hypothetical protein
MRPKENTTVWAASLCDLTLGRGVRADRHVREESKPSKGIFVVLISFLANTLSGSGASGTAVARAVTLSGSCASGTVVAGTVTLSGSCASGTVVAGPGS